MAHPIMDPIFQILDRWRTARSIAHLDTHTLDDIGFQIEEDTLSRSIFDKHGRYIRRIYK